MTNEQMPQGLKVITDRATRRAAVLFSAVSNESSASISAQAMGIQQWTRIATPRQEPLVLGRRLLQDDEAIQALTLVAGIAHSRFGVPPVEPPQMRHTIARSFSLAGDMDVLSASDLKELLSKQRSLRSRLILPPDELEDFHVFPLVSARINMRNREQGSNRRLDHGIHLQRTMDLLGSS